jgi:hypothetical protein
MDSTERSIVPRRVAGVSVALAGTGAVLGGGLTAGLVAISGLALQAANVTVSGAPPILATAGLGAALGAVLTPMTALSLLRQVALGKALLFTMLGMSIGVTAGQVATGRTTVGAGAGIGAFLLTALLLRLTSGARKQPKARTKGDAA